MINEITVLFCCSPLDTNAVDEDFAEERKAALEAGFTTVLFNYDDLLTEERRLTATKKIKASVNLKPIIYRGWMLSPAQYEWLYNDLLAKNYCLINSPEEYRNCHYLPESLTYIKNKTALTIFQKYNSEVDIDKLIEKAEIFGNNAVVLKDYVKSEKHHWEEACFVKNAGDKEKLKTAIKKLIDLRGDFLNEGIVIREFLDLNALTQHSKSGMPLTEEYRLFFCNKQLIGIYDYWEEGDYLFDKPDTSEFETLALVIESNFFSMDIARKNNGELVIIELGDGQVSGLPDKLNKKLFYNKLKALLNN